MNNHLVEIKNWTQQLIGKEESITAALTKINQLEIRLLFVVDSDSILIGTISEGDIRRAIINGKSLSESIAKICNPKPITILKNSDEKKIALALRKLFSVGAPLVDETKKIIGFKVLPDFNLKPISKNVITVIMAGGKGQRLSPLTDNLPKPLLRVGNFSILEILLQKLSSQGFKSIYISVNHLSEMIKNEISDGTHLGIEVSYLDEIQPLGTAGSLSLISNPNQLPILVVNADLITNVSFEDFLNFHNNVKSDISVVLAKTKLKSQYGVVRLNKNKIVEIIEKPVYHENIFAGITLMSEAIRKRIAPSKPLQMTNFISDLLNSNINVFAYEVIDYWSDIGTLGAFNYEQSEINQMTNKS